MTTIMNKYRLMRVNTVILGYLYITKLLINFKGKHFPFTKLFSINPLIRKGRLYPSGKSLNFAFY